MQRQQQLQPHPVRAPRSSLIETWNVNDFARHHDHGLGGGDDAHESQTLIENSTDPCCGRGFCCDIRSELD